jgi:hypothetical protein
MTDPAGPGRVIVGVDGSKASRHALQWAQFMARSLGAGIDAVTVWEISAVEASAWADDWDPEKDATAELHATLAEVLGAEPAAPVREVVLHGSAAAQGPSRRRREPRRSRLATPRVTGPARPPPRAPAPGRPGAG